MATCHRQRPTCRLFYVNYHPQAEDVMERCSVSRSLCIAGAALVLFATSSFALDATSANALAQSVITQLGRDKGFCAIPNCGDGQLARAFLQNSGMKVHAMDTDTAKLRATRQLVEPLGFIGPRFYADKGSLSLMPYTDRFVDCIAITNLTDADLAGIPYTEIERALCPGGMAWVGRATAEGAGITLAALQGWVNAATKARSIATVSTTNGTWALITARELSGVDIWPRHNHGPDGTRYALDSVAYFPWLPQAKLKPYRQDHGTLVTSGGRMYAAFPDINSAATAKQVLKAYSIYNGELLWTRDITSDGLGTLSGDVMTASPDYVYLKQGGALLQLDGKTGAVVRTQNFGLVSLSWWAAGQGTGLVYGSNGSSLVACNEATGAVAWTKSGGSLAMYGNRISCGGTVYNAATGVADGLGALVIPAMPALTWQGETGTPNWGAGCGAWTASVKNIYRQMYGLVRDRVTSQNLAFMPYKTPCNTGMQVSNGFAIFPSLQCVCRFYRGNMVEGPAGSFQLDRACAADGSDRIERGPAWNNMAVQVSADSLDWPTHRSNNSRSGSSLTPIAATTGAAGLLWNWQPPVNLDTSLVVREYDYQSDMAPTPPAVAGSRTFLGGSDGYVRCIDNATGTQAWAYATGGRVYATPTVWDGCVYVGSCDGWAYCLEAHSGRLVWRFRAAPVDRRMNFYGYLSSSWPVYSGVMINQGNAYFVAGMQSIYGVHVYCVNAKSGALVWQNNTSGTCLNPIGRLGFSPTGYMTIAHGKVYCNSATGYMVAFNLATGVQDPTPSLFATTQLCLYGYNFSFANFGSEIGAVDGNHILSGGHRRAQDPRERAMNQHFAFNQLDGSGAVQFPIIEPNHLSLTDPAWDSQDFYSTLNGTNRLTRFSTAGLCAKVDSIRPTQAATQPNGFNEMSGVSFTADFLTTMPTATFLNSSTSINALVLTPNALVATYAKNTYMDYYFAQIPEQTDWYVGAWNRTTGATIWETKLPDLSNGLKGEPLFEGLAVDRNGYIIVVQRNGNVLCYGPSLSVVGRDAMPQALASAPQAAMSVPAAVRFAGATPVEQSLAPAERLPSSVNAPMAAVEQAEHDAAPAGSLVLMDGMSASRQIEPSLLVNGSVTTVPAVRAPGDGSVLAPTMPPEEREQLARERGNPADMRWKPLSVCLNVASVSASSASGKANGAGNTLDRDLRTRWSPGRAGQQWLVYDLGKAREVSSASIVWFALRNQQTQFGIELSVDGKQYRAVDEGTLAGRGTHESLRTFLPQEARFVRISLSAGEAAPAVSVQEVGIHGGAERTSLR
jgi:outer membrane protein assembly factor BamB